METRHDALVDVLEERAGDSFRSAGYYDANSESLLYVRDNLTEETMAQRLEYIVERIRNREPMIEPSKAAGRCKADIELYEKFVIIHWYLEDQRGIITSFEPEVARRLTEFIEECNTALESPETSRYYTE